MPVLSHPGMLLPQLEPFCLVFALFLFVFPCWTDLSCCRGQKLYILLSISIGHTRGQQALNCFSPWLFYVLLGEGLLFFLNLVILLCFFLEISCQVPRLAPSSLGTEDILGFDLQLLLPLHPECWCHRVCCYPCFPRYWGSNPGRRSQLATSPASPTFSEVITEIKVPQGK